MWQKVKSNEDVLVLMNRMNYFHDSCIKEIRYLSGAYVNEDLSMHPINDQRILRIIFQRQATNMSMIEMEFSGLKFLNLYPLDEMYTCEIMDSTMYFENELIYWSDCEVSSESDNKTVVCASNLRWRYIDNHMGNKEFYNSPL